MGLISKRIIEHSISQKNGETMLRLFVPTWRKLPRDRKNGQTLIIAGVLSGRSSNGEVIIITNSISTPEIEDMRIQFQ